MSDSNALGLTLDTEVDVLGVHCREFAEACTKREISSQLADHFHLLGIALSFSLGGKLILQKISESRFAWNEILPQDMMDRWIKWLFS